MKIFLVLTLALVADFAMENNHTYFGAKACLEDVPLIAAAFGNPAYYFLIQFGKVSESSAAVQIKKDKDTSQTLWSSKQVMLNCNEVKYFWMKWSEGELAIGQGLELGSRTLYTFNDADELKVLGGRVKHACPSTPRETALSILECRLAAMCQRRSAGTGGGSGPSHRCPICTHDAVMSPDDVATAARRLNDGKRDGSGLFSTDRILNGGHALHQSIAELFTGVIRTGTTPTPKLDSVVIPIPKNTRKSLNDSKNHRGIAINSPLNKLYELSLLMNHPDELNRTAAALRDCLLLREETGDFNLSCIIEHMGTWMPSSYRGTVNQAFCSDH
ncbi:hypothetical protein CAPTEDRAFT_208341 [Capitella teleta]|uniref:Farnesoic acid O-methyl transferase domain-containing protein n=1 Tax=Capitella teleta TaxID=283909 RepID=R7V0F5_CAPTE|nr:hypothetical protein CAPTEDRAFT_208341 [Capitella teleta]|eukprot:ELU09687.1 hypothetical protein CAPTEDRAFT_208341 [Capitella teleta]